MIAAMIWTPSQNKPAHNINETRTADARPKPDTLRVATGVFVRSGSVVLTSRYRLRAVLFDTWVALVTPDGSSPA